MSELKHTSGPWEAVRNSAFWEVDIQDCFSVAYVWGDDEKQAESNARLIAAAPELLAFAEEWLLRQGSDENYMVSKARAAIAKATGSAA